MNEDIRWQQRFDNYKRALFFLKQNIVGEPPKEFSEMQDAAIAKAFEVVYDLCWNLLKDFLEHEGVQIEAPAPNYVFKKANGAAIFMQLDVDGQIFMDMVKSRNKLTHIYNMEMFQEELIKIKDIYSIVFEKIQDFFMKIEEENV